MTIGRTVWPQPMVVLRDVDASRRFYLRVLRAESGHGGNEYERVVKDGEIVLQIHDLEVEDHHGRLADPEQPLGNGVLLWFEVADFEETVKAVRESGATVVRDMHTNRTRASRRSGSATRTATWSSWPGRPITAREEPDAARLGLGWPGPANDDDLPGDHMSEYAVARLEEIDEISDGRCPSRPVRHHFGITSFGVNTWTGRQAGDRIINEHDETDENEELYLVHSGRARFELDGEQLDAPAGTFVFARPGVKRTAFAEEPGTTLLAVGGTPGQAYEPHGYEIWGQIRPLYDAGNYAEVADRGRELIDANPDYPMVAYNVACCEALVGRKEDALEHLRMATDRSEQLRKLAAEDSDLEALRDEPRFRELVG
jgi:quercetin dioxygenase-like cupin family protein/predicted enzyme related to lactoylglutathione lyase